MTAYHFIIDTLFILVNFVKSMIKVMMVVKKEEYIGNYISKLDIIKYFPNVLLFDLCMLQM